MSNIVSITELRKLIAEKTSIDDWKAFAEMQNTIIDNYEQQVKNLTHKNNQLETILMSKFNDSLISKLMPEENICIQQIDRLEKLSIERQLTLDEVKRLDLLVKNLKLIREESTIIVNNNSNDFKEADLVAIIRADSSTIKSD